MRKRTLSSIAVGLMVAWVLPGVAMAEEELPADVDCSVLRATLDAVDDFLDSQGSQFPSLGVLYSTLVTNETTFNSLNNLIFSFSEDVISFDSGPQLISTIGNCGLTKFMIDNLRD